MQMHIHNLLSPCFAQWINSESHEPHSIWSSELLPSALIARRLPFCVYNKDVLLAAFESALAALSARLVSSLIFSRLIVLQLINGCVPAPRAATWTRFVRMCTLSVRRARKVKAKEGLSARTESDITRARTHNIGAQGFPSIPNMDAVPCN